MTGRTLLDLHRTGELTGDDMTVKRGRGRPSEGERVEVRIPAGLLATIDREAEVAGVTRAEMMRRILAAITP